VLHGIRAASFTLRAPAGEARVELPLPGLYNVYNALAAAALTLTLGASFADVVAGLQAVRPAFGRAETVELGGRPMSILLVKNPAGANEVLRTVALEDGDLLCVLNDNIADGRDVSWVWDADFEILAPRVRQAVCAGTRAAEMALRLKYAGVPTDRIAVEPGLAAAVDRAVALQAAPAPLYALPTYTAMLALRELLVARGVAGSSFG
jgi:UDP-N-acetylmuramyl tripeptide synthase